MSVVSAPGPPRRMASRDAGFLYLERAGAPLHIGCVALVEGRLSRPALLRLLGARLERLPRYRQRAVPVPFAADHPSWEDDPAFDPRRHVTRHALPRPGGPEELREAVAGLLAEPLDRDRPLWEMHLLEGLHGDRCAVLYKVHHCMVDGMAGAQLLELLLDPVPQVPRARSPRRRPRRAAPLPSVRRRLERAVGAALARQARASAWLLRALARPASARVGLERAGQAALVAARVATRRVPALPWNAPVGPRRRLAFTRLPLEGVRRIRAGRGGTVNDVVLAVLAGGLHRYLGARGLSSEGLDVTALVPVSLRSAEESAALGNRTSAVFVPLPAELDDEVARLAAVRARMDRLKAHAEWVGLDAFLGLLDELPPPLVAGLTRQLRLAGLANLIATNVPGPREARYLCGARVAALYPIVPIFHGVGLGIAVFSYDGGLYVGLNGDPGLVPDLEKLRLGIEEAFAALLGSA